MTSAHTETLRDRKRARTRAAIIEAGITLFERDGYDATTVADIAAAADIGTRTFFSYFAGKGELLFPESDARVTTALNAIDSRRPTDRPVDVLIQAITLGGESNDEIFSRLAELRLRMIPTVPAVRARSLHMQVQAQAQIADRLVDAFPELTEVGAAALVGAFVGAVGAALPIVLVDASAGPDVLRERLVDAVSAALRPAPAG